MNKEQYLAKKKAQQVEFDNIQRRETCLNCRRTSSACLCDDIVEIKTNTMFVLLMHPMEAKKEKVGTGRLTKASLKNSKVIMGIDFSNDPEVNELIDNPDNLCFAMYPGKSAINISEEKFTFDKSKKLVIFVIDATWPCAKKMMKLSTNLLDLPRVCFTPTERSKFDIKQQPMEFCLSTIESVHYFLSALEEQGVEKLNKTHDSLLKTLESLVNYQLECESDPNRQTYRRNSFTPFEKRKKSVKWKTRSLFVD
ncbi:tRNA-uridine aminocarboxypropyltransferase [Halobacteriovorax sp.]|uniref:tRNA-uridine aminocarboxypropyltransferase n=1 Tax=Halobacteriovorax sp. TaxID=2020862 RepID=UPI0035624CA3